MMRKAILTIFVLLICVLTTTIKAQKVGLVLSGGGAKGIAHVGVIKALEEHGIPIDYIAGSSMGAIVGALYASGYSASEMEVLFKSEEFKLWSTGKIEEDKVYHFKKLETNASWIELNLKRKPKGMKLQLPTNIIPEEQMDFAFMELFSLAGAACDYDFDNLFVPFRSVATDVYNNKAVIGRAGDLGEAVRASMTFPLYFKPIEVNGILLFDGGIVNNFPTDVMMEHFKPDIIIGHKVANNARKPDAQDLVAQLENLVMKQTNYEIPDSAGILLETNFTNVGLLDFFKMDFIQSKGYHTAIEAIDHVKSRVSRRVDSTEVKARRERFKEQFPQLLFHNIQVEGVDDDMQRRYIIQMIKRRTPIVGLEELRKTYFKLVADGQIKSIRPISRYNKETGLFDLHLKVTPNNPLNIEIGGNVSSKAINQGYFGFKHKIFKDRSYHFITNLYFGRLYSSFLAGVRIDFPTITPSYMSGYFTFNRWDFYSSSTELFFEDVKPAYIIQNENNFRLNLGFPIRTNGLVEFGLSHSYASDKYYQIDDFSSEDKPDKTTFDAYSAHLKIEKKTLNDKAYATSGTHKLMEVKLVGGKETNYPGTTSTEPLKRKNNHTFLQVKLHYDEYFKLTDWFTLGALGEVVFNNKDVFLNYTSTMLNAPGFAPTPYTKTLFINKFHSNSYLAGGGRAIFNLSDDFHFRLEGYYFFPTQKILKLDDYSAKYDSRALRESYFTGAGSLVYKTPIGPASISLNYYEREGEKFSFLFNFGYVIFNKRGF